MTGNPKARGAHGRAVFPLSPQAKSSGAFHSAGLNVSGQYGLLRDLGGVIIGGVLVRHPVRFRFTRGCMGPR